MAKLPESVSRGHIPRMRFISRGKVRDTYALEDEQLLLPVATDRLSIFDFVLPAEVSQKGEVLNALNVFWTIQLGSDFSNDMVAFGSGINNHIAERFRTSEIQKRATVVRKLKMIPVEAVVRGYLTGSGWSAYQKSAPNHSVCGQSLPAGLKDGDRLPRSIFTPTTKAEVGHDEQIDAGAVEKEYGPKLEATSLHLFRAASEIALKRGIIIADTKLEFGEGPGGKLVLGDERFTPDSSRFWLQYDWAKSREEGRSPISFDKQFVREWGKGVDIDKLDPKVPEEVAMVHGLIVPPSVLMRTSRLYRYIFYLLTGMRLEYFQRKMMGIKTYLPPVEVVIGSSSDLPEVEDSIKTVLGMNGVPYRVHVISCHRNPEVLREYAAKEVPDNATVIAAAGKAAALPGVLQAWLRHYNQGHIPVIGVALGKDDESRLAANLSIEELPGKPVVLSGNGKAYGGRMGFAAACMDVVNKEILAPAPSPKKDAIASVLSSVGQFV